MARVARRRHQRRYPSLETHTPRPIARPRVEIDRSLAWYAIRAAYKAEGRADEALRNAGFATYLPTEAVRIHRRGKLVELERMPVSGYLFVGLCAREPDFSLVKMALNQLWPITPAFGSLIRIDRQPVRIGAGAIQAFADECTGGLAGLAGGLSRFRKGQKAKVVGGNWSGFEIDLERVACDHPIVGLIDMMGRKTRVEVTEDQLEAA
jgi:hypothetical protein